MASFLEYLYGQQGNNLMPGLLGASNASAQMAQYGNEANAQAAQGAQRVQAAMQNSEAEGARGLQEAVQRREAEEAAQKQAVMNIGMMLATGGFGGGGEAANAAAGGAGEAVTSEMAKQGAEKAMAEIAPKEFLSKQVANPDSFLFDPVKAMESGASFQDIMRPARSGLLGNNLGSRMRW